jgi:hypothetical protein
MISKKGFLAEPSCSIENGMEEIAMTDITDKIMAEFESDPTINAKSLNLVMTSRGFLKRRRILNVYGTVESATEKDRAMKIVQRQAGDNYDVEDKIVVIGSQPDIR